MAGDEVSTVPAESCPSWSTKKYFENLRMSTNFKMVYGMVYGMVDAQTTVNNRLSLFVDLVDLLSSKEFELG